MTPDCLDLNYCPHVYNVNDAAWFQIGCKLEDSRAPRWVDVLSLVACAKGQISVNVSIAITEIEDYC